MMTFFIRMRKFLADWNELWLLPLALLIYFVVVPFLQTIDPNVGTFSLEYLLRLVMLMVYFIWIHGLAWLFFKLFWPELYFNIGVWTKQFLHTAPLWQRTLLSISIFCFYLLLLVLMLLAL